VTSPGEKCGRCEPSETGSDDDDASWGHGYSPRVMPVTSWTPATAPAT
jgi:hypothetical protein